MRQNPQQRTEGALCRCSGSVERVLTTNQGKQSVILHSGLWPRSGDTQKEARAEIAECAEEFNPAEGFVWQSPDALSGFAVFRLSYLCALCGLCASYTFFPQPLTQFDLIDLVSRGAQCCDQTVELFLVAGFALDVGGQALGGQVREDALVVDFDDVDIVAVKFAHHLEQRPGAVLQRQPQPGKTAR